MKRFGIDRSNYLFSLRATLASLAALWIAFTLGLESPQWAAITVWVVTQPSRGKTLSKGFYRFLGTCVGALFAIFLIHFFDQTPLAFLFLLAVWMGMSTAGANLVQYFRSYGMMLAGITAAIVGLSVFSHPDHVMQVAQARILCIFLGILVSLVVASLLSQGSAKKDLYLSLDRILEQLLLWARDVFLRRPRYDLIEGERRLITQISLIDEMTVYAAAESMQVRRQRDGIHGYLASLFASISALRALGLHFRKNPALIEVTLQQRQQSARALELLAEKLGRGKTQELNFQSNFETSSETTQSTEWKVLMDRLTHFQATLKGLFNQYLSLANPTTEGGARSLYFHRDLRHAWAVGMRSALAVLIVGAIWLATRWPVGPLLVIMTAVNCGIFATSNNPKSGIWVAFKVSLLSVLASLICLKLYFLGPQNIYFLFVLLALFLLPGGLLVTHPTKSLAGTLFCVNFLVFVSPADPMPAFLWSHFFSLALGFFAAILLTFVVFSFIFPTDPKKRSEHMTVDIVRDLERMARATSDYRAYEWETLMYNRVSNLIKVLAETGEVKQGILEGCFAALDMGQEIIRLREMGRSRGLSEKGKELIERILTDLSLVRENPKKASGDLRSLSLSASTESINLENTVGDLADWLDASEAFFKGEI